MFILHFIGNALAKECCLKWGVWKKDAKGEFPYSGKWYIKGGLKLSAHDVITNTLTTLKKYGQNQQ